MKSKAAITSLIISFILLVIVFLIPTYGHLVNKNTFFESNASLGLFVLYLPIAIIPLLLIFNLFLVVKSLLKEEKTYATLALIIFVIVIFVIITGFLLVRGYIVLPKTSTQIQQNQNNSQNPTSNTQTQTAGWKTYTNTQYGFEFQYPFINSFIKLSTPGLISGPININSDGCFTGNSKYPNPVTEKQKLMVNNIPFCVSWTSDSAMGHSYPIYFYTTQKNGSYFTIALPFNVTACDNLKGGANYNPCVAFFNDPANNPEKIASNSISTFKFTNANNPQTANWKTYANTQYGFSFQYPASFTVTSTSVQTDPRPEARQSYVVHLFDDKNEMLIHFGFNPDADPLQTSQQFLTTLKISQPDEWVKVGWKDVLVDGRPALQEHEYFLDQVNPTVWGKYTGAAELIIIHFKEGNDRWSFVLEPTVDSEYKTNTLTIRSIGLYEKIISTFKFTNSQNQVAGWKTYTNTQYGFSFQYPDKLNSGYIDLSGQPSSIVTPQNTSAIDASGCYKVSNANVEPESQVTINNMQFCLLVGTEGTAGTGYITYYYTTLKNSNYYTLKFVVSQRNCGSYDDGTATGGPQHQACVNDEKNYNAIAMKPIQDSVATLRFTK